MTSTSALPGTTITNLPAATSLDGTELVPLVQGGTTKYGTTGQISGSINTALTNAAIVFTTSAPSAFPSGRQLAASSPITVTDGGAGASVTVALSNVTVPFGGTGLTTFTANQVVLGGSAATSPLQQVTGGTSGYVLMASSATTAPSWQNPASIVSNSSFPFVMASSDSGLSGARKLSAQSGVTLITDGGGSSNITVGIVTNGIGAAQFRQSAGLSVVGVTANASGNVADITGTTDQLLRVSSAGTALGFGKINLNSSLALSGVLGTEFGGTGSSSPTVPSAGTAGQLAYYSSTNVISPSSWASLSSASLTLGSSASSVTGRLILASSTAGNTTTFQPSTGSASVTIGTSGGTIGVVGFATLGQIPGTTTNDSASSGNIGEYVYSKGTGGTATVTISTAALVSWSSHGLNIASPVNFTTTGTLPTGISSGINYYVCSANFGSNSFNVSTSVNNALSGTALSVTSSGTGTHTGYSNIFLTTGTQVNLTGISLTAGDWDVTNLLTVNSTGAGAVVNAFITSPSTTSATLATDIDRLTAATIQSTGFIMPNAGTFFLGLQPARFSFSATTTVYQVAYATFSVLPLNCAGIISARRAR